MLGTLAIIVLGLVVFILLSIGWNSDLDWGAVFGCAAEFSLVMQLPFLLYSIGASNVNAPGVNREYPLHPPDAGISVTMDNSQVSVYFVKEGKVLPLTVDEYQFTPEETYVQETVYSKTNSFWHWNIGTRDPDYKLFVNKDIKINILTPGNE